ncbi:MAG: polysaccharide deacetylase family protein [Planctomycetota bacterium]
MSTGHRSAVLVDTPQAPPTTPRVLVVMYHYVRDVDALPRPGAPGPYEGIKGLTTSQFSAQLDQLCSTLEPIDWPTFFAGMNGAADLPERSFLLTFDDGLADHAETVLPILEGRGLRGVFFVSGAVLTEHRMLPAHAIHLLLSALGDEPLERELCNHLSARTDYAELTAPLKDDAIAPRSASTMYHYEAPRRARLKYWLTMQLPIDVRNEAVDALFERHIGAGSRWARHWYLGWADLVRMQSSGHTIGGHGFSHEPLARLSDDDVRRDVTHVARVLREGLGADYRPFSYPYGSHPEAAADACRDRGFAHAFTTEPRWIEPSTDKLLLPRVDAVNVEMFLRRLVPQEVHA